MAITVNFWSTFSKRKNSTAQPPAQADQILYCVLKSDSGILNPTLEIGWPMSSSPASLTYAQIPSYSRYYWVTDWQWSGGLWLCSLMVDPLASYKAVIGASSRYILRAAADYNPDLIDDLYTATAKINDYTTTASYNWAASITAGHFVLGILNRSQHLGMPVTYYDISPPEIRDLMSIMFPEDVDSWDSAITSANESLIRAIYDPLQFIVSCKWFPCPISHDDYELVGFGNWSGSHLSASGSDQIVGDPVSNPADWMGFTMRLNLPQGWASRPARERSAPACHIYLIINPWGIIEIDPIDVCDAAGLIVNAYPDYISGDCRLEVLAVIPGTPATERLIYQRNATIAIDIPLVRPTTNIGGVLSSLAGFAASAAIAASGGGAAAASTMMAGANLANAAVSMQPTMSGGGGAMSGMINIIGGNATLRVRTAEFPPEANSEFGRPLCAIRTISTIPGYIKCGDGDIQIAGFDDERIAISEYMTGGFYYE